MPPIEVGPTRAITAISAAIARKAGEDVKPGANGVAANKTPTETPTVSTASAIAAGEPPVDTDRVSAIRKAVETGNYPLIPAKISDAMIAAGVMLRSAKA